MILTESDDPSFVKIKDIDLEEQGMSLYQNYAFEVIFTNKGKYAKLYARDKEGTLVFNFTTNPINKKKSYCFY